jgi:transcription-repair coupling factor (superfamily II helicase)
MPLNLSDVVSKKLNAGFVKEKFDVLEKEPIVFKNLPNHLVKFAGDVLSNITQKSFDIVVCKGQDLPNVIESYAKDSVKSISCSVLKEFQVKNLEDAGFQRVRRVWQKGEYSFLGDILILWPFNYSNPIRVSLLDNIVENIDVVDKNSFQKIESLKNFEIVLYEEVDILTYNMGFEKVAYPFVFLEDKQLQIDYGYPFFDFGFRDIPSLDYYLNNKSVLLRIVDDYISKGYQIICSTKEVKRVGDVFQERNFLLIPTFLERGFVNPELKILVLSDYELFGKVDLGQGDWLKQILPGDFVVHEDHGIGIFERIVEEKEDTYIEIAYANKDKLLVPLSQNQKVTKYVGGRGRIPTLTTLHSGSWKRVKKKVKIDAQALAKELLQIYAMREVLGFEIAKEKKALEKELQKFVKDFEFEDTHDQSLVTQEIFDDIFSGKLMDRLLIGDVGFGKTELAMRAAFLSVKMGLQVAVLAPTTILVEQHGAVFRKRFEKHGVKIESLSRFLSANEKKEKLKKLENGDVDIIIGTHSLLYDSVQFKNLGLIVIDEEQKFGVKQKEKLKQKRLQSHVLSMSATPIPRSLGMSLSGIRDISTLFSPPEGRKSILNKFGSFDWDVVKKAIDFEVKRKGQVYFLHNKVLDISFVQKKLNEMFPLLNIAILHGQMHGDDISRVMNAFCNGKVDVLICTTIIENGLDIPNVNTLIVDDASRFGLSQLYQIRGRIGRSDVQAHAYFLYKSMKGNTELRLDALMEAQDLGSGFLLANRDLEIRGVGDLLGKAQSGDINAVGYGLFMKYLSEAVERLK